MASQDGWSGLFSTAFAQSRNAMVLLDDQRRHVDANGAYIKLLGHTREELIGRPVYEFVAGGPVAAPDEWEAMLATGRFTGEANLVSADGSVVAVQWGASAEMLTGRRLVLFVALNTSRWGPQFRRTIHVEPEGGALSNRELEVVRLVALGSTGPEIAGELQISQHGPHARAQRDEQARRPLPSSSRRKGRRRRARGGVSQVRIAQLRYGPSGLGQPQSLD